MNQLAVLISIILGLCLLGPSNTQTANYCAADLCKGKVHIACNNTGALNKACTASAQTITITDSLRKAIIMKHNNLRNKIAQGGFNGYQPALRMATMCWSNELAKVATFNVKQCVMQHDKCRNTAQFKYAGQNLANTRWKGMTQTVQAVAMSHIQLWFDEWKFCNMALINKFQILSNFKDYGHFTSMMQEKSTHVGCAILRQNINGFTQQFMACNYAFTNIIDKEVYRKGPAASGCKTGKNINLKALCSIKEVYNVNSANY